MRQAEQELALQAEVSYKRMATTDEQVPDGTAGTNVTLEAGRRHRFGGPGMRFAARRCKLRVWA
jgi:hypothetical protein